MLCHIFHYVGKEEDNIVGNKGCIIPVMPENLSFDFYDKIRDEREDRTAEQGSKRYYQENREIMSIMNMTGSMMNW